MRTFITDTAQIQQYITVDISSKYDILKPYLVESHKQVKKVLDNATFQALLDYANSETQTEEALTTLLDHVRAISANFAYLIGAEKLMISVGQIGISRMENTNAQPATLEEIEAFKKSCGSSGYNAIEETILLIKSQPTEYTDAYAYLFDNGLFINSSEEVNQIIKSDMAYRDFLAVRPKAFLFEQKVSEIVGTDRFANMKTETLTAENQALLDTYILPAEACYIYGIKYNDTDILAQAEALLQKLNTSLTPTSEPYQNTADSGFFIFS